MRESSLDLVSALCLDEAGWLLAVDKEPRRETRPLIGGHDEFDVLPAVTVFLAEFTEPGQAASRRDQSFPSEATSGSEQAGLGVSVAVCLTQGQALTPRCRRGVENFLLDATQRPDLVIGRGVLAHHPHVRGGVLG